MCSSTWATPLVPSTSSIGAHTHPEHVHGGGRAAVWPRDGTSLRSVNCSTVAACACVRGPPDATQPCGHDPHPLRAFLPAEEKRLFHQCSDSIDAVHVQLPRRDQKTGAAARIATRRQRAPSPGHTDTSLIGSALSAPIAVDHQPPSRPGDESGSTGSAGLGKPPGVSRACLEAPRSMRPCTKTWRARC